MGGFLFFMGVILIRSYEFLWLLKVLWFFVGGGFFMVGGFFSGSDSYDWNIMMGCTDFCSLMVPVFY